MRLFRRRVQVPDGPPSYWNSSVVDRIQREENIDAETAAPWFREMLVFLDLCARADMVLSPPKPVDAAWHAFLLHSRDYEAYCRERFGRVIHHEPTGAADRDAYRRAWESRTTYPGAPDPVIWAIPPIVADGDGERGDGEEHAPGLGEGGGGSSESGGSSSCGGSSCGSSG